MHDLVIWYLGVKYGNSAYWLEIAWNFAKMMEYVFLHDKIISSQLKSFLQVFKISPMVSSANAWVILYLRVKYGNFAYCLEIAWNFAKMMEHVFLHEKIISSQLKSFLQVFKISPMVSSANAWFGNLVFGGEIW